MRLENKIVLNEMYHELLEEKKSLLTIVEKNLSTIHEIEEFVKSLHEKENNDYQMFSPRNLESTLKEKIGREEEKRLVIENENHNHYQNINRIQGFIDRFESIINDSVNEAEIQNDSMIEKYNKIASQNLSELSIVENNILSENNNKINISILDIQEQDRQRIARDLHDTSLQELAHIVHMNELASLYLEEDKIKAKLQLASINKNLKSVIEEIRKIIFDLRPMSFDDLGFKETLEDLFSKLSTYSKVSVVYSIEEIKCSEEILINIYRIINECCNNSLKHSGCTKLTVKVYQCDDKISIEIQDNGKGFDVLATLNLKSNHFGIRIMKERVHLLNGSFDLISNKNEGTVINILIPINISIPTKILTQND